MTTGELQDRIWNVERIRVVVHADYNANVSNAEYWVNAFPGNRTVTDFKQIRLNFLTEAGIGYVVLDGKFVSPNGKTLMETLRATY